jgi:hypothetical protein
MNSEYTALAGRIHQSLLDLKRVVDRADYLLSQALQKEDDGYFDGVALNLHGFYGGVERIFEDIARSVDQSIPGGPEWHRDLLLQMANELASIRPAVITPDTRHCLDEYRGFRHLVRNVYTFNLRPSRLRELTEELQNCYQAVTANLDEFLRVLEQSATDCPNELP